MDRGGGTVELGDFGGRSNLDVGGPNKDVLEDRESLMELLDTDSMPELDIDPITELFMELLLKLGIDPLNELVIELIAEPNRDSLTEFVMLDPMAELDIEADVEEPRPMDPYKDASLLTTPES